MDMSDVEREEEMTLDQILTPSQAYFHERSVKLSLNLVGGSS